MFGLFLIPPGLSVKLLAMDEISDGAAKEQPCDQQHRRCYCAKEVEADANASAFDETEHKDNEKGNPREQPDNSFESLQPIRLVIEGCVRNDVHPPELDTRT